MNIHYIKLDVHSNKQLVEKVIKLHNRVFNDSSNWSTQLNSKPSLVIFVAFHDSKVVGYKIGYALNEKTFYSWLGGVDTKYRNHGIARMLMEKQHEYLKKNGYKKVQTKTKNKWRDMLILNIKNGFDVIGTYTDDSGEPKIILEKKLT